METENSDFIQDMEQLLDEHDYALPAVGDIRTGVIVSITGQGIIVDLGLKRDGIVPQSDLDKLPQEERDSLQVNDEIDVYIQSTDQPDSLIVSRHMALLNQDWIRAQSLLESGDIFDGKIIGHNRGGALVEFGGLNGFVPASHLSALSPNLNDKQRQQRLSRLRGEIVPLKVIEVDRRRRRLVLSERDASKVRKEENRQELLESLEVGDVRTGRVSGWKDFGAFVDLGGVDGLVHVSELAWYRVNHPRQVLKIGDEIDVYVLKVDRERGRISLSRKKLLPNPWSLVDKNYHENQLVEGRIIRIVDYGAFVELEPGIEGLLHVSQLSRAQVNDPREVVQEGETHLLRVISIDSQKERIGLSLKAVRAQEQIEWMTRKELEAEAERAAQETKVEEVETVSEESVEEPEPVETEEATSAHEIETIEEETITEVVEDEVVDLVEKTVVEAEEVSDEAAEVTETITGADETETAELEMTMEDTEVMDLDEPAAETKSEVDTSDEEAAEDTEVDSGESDDSSEDADPPDTADDPVDETNND